MIIAFCSTYYTTSIKRTRRNARDDMAREVAKRGLVSDVESTTWLNLFSELYLGSIDTRTGAEEDLTLQ